MKTTQRSKYYILITLAIISCFLIQLFIGYPSGHISGNNRRNTTDLFLSGDQNNNDFLNDVMDDKLSDYAAYDFFPTYFEESLQSNFHALMSFSALGRMDMVNQSEMVNFIMDHYDSQLGYFIDEYAIRYLDTNFDEYFIPLNTLLEVNCYAILSLYYVDALDLIDTQTFIDFIWDCFDYDIGGFIGQPYEESLTEEFKIPTLDNTYYAARTLDILIEDWNAYAQERNLMITFIADCQSTSPVDGFFGGFNNDLDGSFNSLRINDPNMLSSYYALKTLECFNAMGTINVEAFHDYLDDMYNTAEGYFEISWLPRLPTYGIPAATGIGLELSLLTEYPNINEEDTFTYLKNIQNNLGLWTTSLDYNQFELINTYHVLRSLLDSGYIANLTTTEKNEIVNGLSYFKGPTYYANIPISYMSIPHLTSVIRSFKLFNREMDLDINGIYNYLKDAYLYNTEFEERGFYGYTNEYAEYIPFRIYPIEYYNFGNYSSLKHTDYVLTHKFSYQALTALNDIFKLDDFEMYSDLNELVNETVRSQITDPVSEKFGAFLPSSKLLNRYQEIQDEYVFLEYSYYAVKTLKFLSEYLNLGPITDLINDVEALKTYAFNTFYSPGSYCYSMPRATDDVNRILMNTFYASYLLKTFDSFNKDEQKIKNYIEDHLDYTDIENIYYSWKLDGLLDLDIEFEVETVQQLVQEIYFEHYSNFYITSNQKKINHEILYWICDIAKHDKFRYDISFDEPVQLDTDVMITVIINNLVLDGMSDYGSLVFESDQVGEFPFTEVSEGIYRSSVSVPLSDSNFPIVFGNVCRYEFSTKQEEVPIIIDTTYDFISDVMINENVHSVNFEINTSILTGSGQHALADGDSYIRVYREGEFLSQEQCSSQHYDTYTLFTTEYEYPNFGEYVFSVFVNDGINGTDHFLGNYTQEYTYELESEVSSFVDANSIEILLNASLLVEGTENIPVNNGEAYIECFYEGTHLGQELMDAAHENSYSLFNLTCPFSDFGTYRFEIFLNDSIDPSIHFIDTIIHEHSYTLETDVDFSTDVESVTISLNGSLLVEGIENRPLPDGQAYANVYYNGTYLEKKFLSLTHFNSYSIFDLLYEVSQFGTYSFELYLNDGHNQTDHCIGEYTYEYSYELITNTEFSSDIEEIEFMINGSMLIVDTEYRPLTEGEAYIRIYFNEVFQEESLFVATHMDTYSVFDYSYETARFGNYSFELYLNDGINQTDKLIETYLYDYSYELITNTQITNSIGILDFWVNSSLLVMESEYRSLENGQVYMNVFSNGEFLEQKIFTIHDYLSYSVFDYSYELPEFGDYLFGIYISDGHNISEYFLDSYTHEYEYDLNVDTVITNQIDAIEFWVNASILINNQEYRAIEDGMVCDHIFYEGELLQKVNFTGTHFETYSIFELEYNLPAFGNFFFELYLDDGHNISNHLIKTHSYDYIYELITDPSISPHIDSIDFTVIGSLLVMDTEYRPVSNGTAYMNVFFNDNFLEERSLSEQEFSTYTEFTLTYMLTQFGNYSFEVYINDGIKETDYLLETYLYEYTYELLTDTGITNNITSLDFTVNGSMVVMDTDYRPLSGGYVFMKLYFDNILSNTIYFNDFNFDTYTIFNNSYELTQFGNYSFELYLNDGVNDTDHLLDMYFYEYAYELVEQTQIINNIDSISFEINASLYMAEMEYWELENGRGYVNIYKNGFFIGELNLTAWHYDTYSIFYSPYNLPQFGNYTFEIYLDDGFNETDRLLETYSCLFTYELLTEVNISSNIDLIEFSVNASIFVESPEYSPLPDGEAYLWIYYNDLFQEEFILPGTHFDNYSYFENAYNLNHFGNYTFELYLNDGYNITNYLLETYCYEYYYHLNAETESINNIDSLEFNVNASMLVLDEEYRALEEGEVYGKIYYNNEFLTAQVFTATHYDKYTLFSLEYMLPDFGCYTFEILLSDGYNITDSFLETYIYNYSYELITEENFTCDIDHLDFSINASALIAGMEYRPLNNGDAYIRVYRDGNFIEQKSLYDDEYGTYTEFRMGYDLNEFGEYTFEIYLNDGYNETYQHLKTFMYDYYYELYTDLNITNNIESIKFWVNGSLLVQGTQHRVLLGGEVSIDVYLDGDIFDTIECYMSYHDGYTLFRYTYDVDEFGNYTFEIYINDGIEPADQLLDTYQHDFYYELVNELNAYSTPSALEFTINASILLSDTLHTPVRNGDAYMEIYYEDEPLEDRTFNQLTRSTSTEFALTYGLEQYGQYIFYIYMEDGISSGYSLIHTYFYEYSYDLLTDIEVVNNTNSIEFHMNASLLVMDMENQSLENGEGYIQMYQDEILREEVLLSAEHFDTYTTFDLTYEPSEFGNYLFKLYINDGIGETHHFLGMHNFEYTYKLITDSWNEADIDMMDFVINSSLYVMDTFYENLDAGNAYVNIFLDEVYLSRVNFSGSHYDTYSIFSLTYELTQFGFYSFEIYLKDGHNSTDQFIGEMEYDYYYDLLMEPRISIDVESVDFILNTSMLLVNTDTRPVLDGNGYISIFFEGDFTTELLLTEIHTDTYSFFHNGYDLALFGNYTFQMYFNDGINETDYLVDEVFYSYTYELCHKTKITNHSDSIDFSVNASMLLVDTEYRSIPNGMVHMKIYRDDLFLETINLSDTDFSNYSLFETDYDLIKEGSYQFKLYISDGFENINITAKVFTYNYYYTLTSDIFLNQTDNFLSFSVNASLFIVDTEYRPLNHGTVFLQIYANGTFHDEKKFTGENYNDYSLFELTYELTEAANYTFDVYVNDGIESIDHLVHQEHLQYGMDTPDDPTDPDPNPNETSNTSETIPIYISLPVILFPIVSTTGMILITHIKKKQTNY